MITPLWMLFFGSSFTLSLSHSVICAPESTDENSNREDKYEITWQNCATVIRKNMSVTVKNVSGKVSINY